MLFDGSLRYPELMGDAGVGASLGHEPKHLALTRAQHIERIPSPPRCDQFLDYGRINDRAALDNPLNHLDEVVDVGDAALQQVTAAFSVREQIHRVLDLDMRRKDEDRGL